MSETDWNKKRKNVEGALAFNKIGNIVGSSIMQTHPMFSALGTALGSGVNAGIDAITNWWQNLANKVEYERAKRYNTPKEQWKRLKASGVNPFFLVGNVQADSVQPFEYNYSGMRHDMAGDFKNIASGMQSLSAIPGNLEKPYYLQAKEEEAYSKSANLDYVTSWILPQTKEKNDLNLAVQRLQSKWLQNNINDIMDMEQDVRKLDYNASKMQFANFVRMQQMTTNDGWIIDVDIDRNSNDWDFVMYKRDEKGNLVEKPCDENGVSPYLLQLMSSWYLSMSQQFSDIQFTNARTRLAGAQQNLANKQAGYYDQATFTSQSLQNLQDMKYVWQDMQNQKFSWTWEHFLETGEWADSDDYIMRSLAMPGNDLPIDKRGAIELLFRTLQAVPKPFIPAGF